MNKANKNSRTASKTKGILIGAGICFAFLMGLLIAATICIENEYVELASGGYLVIVIHFAAVFLGVLLTEILCGSNLMVSALITPTVYCFVLFGIAIAVFDGVGLDAIVISLVCIAAGFSAHLANYIRLNKASKSKKRRHAW